MSSSQQQPDKGKGRARQDGQDEDGGDDGHAGQSRQSPFEPERPRQGPWTSSRQSQNDAKRTLRKLPQPPLQQEKSDQQSSQQAGPSSGSGEKDNAGSEQGGQGQGQDVSSSQSMQRLPSTGSYYQMVRQPPRLKIREDVSKSTSFDRARDGDLLYNLWVGPP